jgi:hypothetical protein
MRSKLLLFPALFAISFAIACGGDMDEIEFCNEAQSALCGKLHNCLPAAVKDDPAVKAAIGLNAGDCTVKFRAEQCNADKAKCMSGKSYHADQAENCLGGLRNLSCTDIQDLSNIPTPAACNLVCT